MRERGLDVTCSHEVSPQFREYERTVTTAVNAYLRPACRSYLNGLAGVADEVLVMTSAGGLVPVDADQGRGPSPACCSRVRPAGVHAGRVTSPCRQRLSDAITFDMGGTSTDVCLVLGGRPEPAGDRVVGGVPVRLPSLDVHTIGAGGGSIAMIDAGGALVVGPRSAGAVPGPACYGHGGTEPTVTDADVVAGRIPLGAGFGGIGAVSLDRRSAARAALAPSRRARAEGVIAVVDAG